MPRHGAPLVSMMTATRRRLVGAGRGFGWGAGRGMSGGLGKKDFATLRDKMRWVFAKGRARARSGPRAPGRDPQLAEDFCRCFGQERAEKLGSDANRLDQNVENRGEPAVRCGLFGWSRGAIATFCPIPGCGVGDVLVRCLEEPEEGIEGAVGT